MRELTITQAQQVELHRLYAETGGSAGARLDWREMDLHNTVLFKVDLRGADLSRTDLSEADLSLADLRNTYMRCANLQHAKLRGANMRNTDLHGADLSGADLNGADLRGTDLNGADLSGADLRGAYFVNSVSQAGSRHDKLVWNYHADVEGGLMFKTGCFWGALAEFAAAVENEHSDDKWGRQYRGLIEAARVDVIRWREIDERWPSFWAS